MLENWLSWVWVVMAVLLAIAEIFTAGFFLIGFAIGAAAAAVAAFMGFAPLAQFAVFVVASALSLLLARPLVNRGWWAGKGLSWKRLTRHAAVVWCG
jgi:membrane protein implicated in regulation of membrane protease activity